MILSASIKKKIEERSGSVISSVNPLSGGCISDAYRISLDSGESFFLKLNHDSASDMFVKEAHGLSELQKADCIKIPEVILYDNSFLLTEFIAAGIRTRSFFSDFGRRFAELHKYKGKSFGFFEDNYIGSNPQMNVPAGKQADDWPSFFFEKRLLFQFKLAEENGFATKELRDGIKGIEKRIDKILDGSDEPPCLLHGDLWSGNFMSDSAGEPCIIDPAVYYGHREADLAMTKLFGGFDRDFYIAYNETFPLKENYGYRENIYKLYHVLNHLNLFGIGYYSQAMALIGGYLR